MRIVFNSTYHGASAEFTRLSILPRLIKKGYKVTENDPNYKRYDLALFMSPDSQVLEAQQMNPKIKTGIIDPKLARQRQIIEAKAANFLLVTSMEQRDAYLAYNENTFAHFMFPETPKIKKEHQPKKKIIIGYHGNKLHLHCMIDVSRALDNLSQKYDIELWAFYNVKLLGLWKINRPKNCKVRDIQWTEDFYKELSQCDIGIVPAKIPHRQVLSDWCGRYLTSHIRNWTGYTTDDYIMRFKYSNNPGRVYTFSQLYIPVVADFTPSYCQIIHDDHSGSLVYSQKAWEYALEKLIKSAKLRNQFSAHLAEFIAGNYSPDINFSTTMKNLSPWVK